VDAQRVPVVPDDPPTREDDVPDVADPLVRSLGAEGPLGGPGDDPCRTVAVEQGEPRAVDRPGRGEADAVVQDEPAVRGQERWRPDPDLVRRPGAVLPGR